MIYALRATNSGRALVQNGDTNLPFCRSLLLIAVVSQQKSWVEWTSIDSILREMLTDLKQQPHANDALEVKSLEKYIESPSKKVDDVLKLESQELIQAARYRSPSGQFVKEKPVGMVFRMNK